MNFDEIDECLQPYVLNFYKHQAVYLRTGGRADQKMREHHHVQFNEARKYLGDAGCSFKKNDAPKESADNLENLCKKGLYQIQLQELVLQGNDVLFPADNLEGEVRRICDRIK